MAALRQFDLPAGGEICYILQGLIETGTSRRERLRHSPPHQWGIIAQPNQESKVVLGLSI